jgi:Ca2+-binding RTX toxin-like protein
MPIIMGTPAGEVLTGTAGDDEIHGLEGHDYLRDRLGGNDKLFGGDDDDLMNGGFGDDEFYGGNGFDRVSLYDHTFRITSGCKASLQLAGVAQDTGQGMDVFGRDVEHLSGTYFDDKLTGNDEANWLWGQNYDHSAGGGGAIVANADVLKGEGGDDLLEAGFGDNMLAGGAGADTASIRHVTGALNVSLLLQGAVQDTLQGMMLLKQIENLSGADFADTFTGNGADNALLGNGGGDALYGGKGNDALYGDGWMDVDTHGTGYSGPIVLNPSNATDFAGLAASGQDELAGGKGRDVLVGGHDADKLSGGSAEDTFVYLETLDSKPAGSEDVIEDLQDALDKIDLSAIDADTSTGADDAFVLVGALSGAAAEVALRYDAIAGITYMECEVNGDGIVDMAVKILGDHTAFVNFNL